MEIDTTQKTLPQSEFYRPENIRKLEAQQFPEFTEEPRAQSPLQPDGKVYGYFAPSHYFETGLVNKAVVEDIIQQDKRVLTVGAGAAHLEQFLVKHTDIKPQQITLADIHPGQLPPGFTHVQLDMFKPWPETSIKYDEIWFPHSVLLDPRETSINGGVYYWTDIVKNALSYLKPGGEIRASSQSLKPKTLDWVLANLKMKKDSVELSSDLLVVKKPQ